MAAAVEQVHDVTNDSSNIKWEDSGIIVNSDAMTPEDETKQSSHSWSQQQSKFTAADVVDDDDDDDDDATRRRSSAGICSLSSSDDVGAQSNVVVVVSEYNDDVVKNDINSKLSVGTSPRHQTSSSSSSSSSPPRVDFQKNTRCDDVMKAVEILLTCYRLPDIAFRQCHRYWSPWTCSGGMSIGSRDRRFDDVSNDISQQLKQLNQQIERRHLEIAEMLRKLLELDAANKVEAEALVLLAAVSDNTGTISPSATLSKSQRVSAAVPTTSGTVMSDDEDDVTSRPLKRRNPFSRAMHALRKKFARPQHCDPNVPVAA